MRWQHRRIACLLAGFWLGLAGSAWAGPYLNVMQPCDCPPNHYSVFHVLTPAIYRWEAWIQGPRRYTFARTLHPEVATTYYLKRYHCPSVNPLQFALQNYPGFNGRPPASSYQSPSQTEQTPRELPPPRPAKLPAPEQLPPPREETDKK